jgi:hypothetical protein
MNTFLSNKKLESHKLQSNFKWIPKTKPQPKPPKKLEPNYKWIPKPPVLKEANLKWVPKSAIVSDSPKLNKSASDRDLLDVVVEILGY